jgi:hypothetical protein
MFATKKERNEEFRGGDLSAVIWLPYASFEEKVLSAKSPKISPHVRKAHIKMST